MTGFDEKRTLIASGPGDSRKAEFREHDVVTVRYSVDTEAGLFEAGMRGTVVSVEEQGASFAVEFTGLPGGTVVVFLSADQLEPARFPER